MELIVIGASAKMGKMGGHFGQKKKAPNLKVGRIGGTCENFPYLTPIK